MGIFYFAQLVLPLIVLFGLFLFPPNSRFAVAIAALATLLWLAAIWLAGIWLFLPRWLVIIYLICFAGAFWRTLNRRPIANLPRTRRDGIVIATALVLAIAGAIIIAGAIRGRTPPDGPIIELVSPLAGKDYMVASGGYSAVTNGGHHMTLDQSVRRFRDYFGQSMAVDVVRLNPWGRTAQGLRPANPAAYTIFGDEVSAPCAGRIIAARGDIPDNNVPQMNRTYMLGNHVILRCGEFEIVLAHFRQGSLAVSPGDIVNTGAKLGEVGNSGNSGEPHLHIHAQRPARNAKPISGTPLPIKIDGRYLVRNDRF